jgi:integration host factor subunit beta
MTKKDLAKAIAEEMGLTPIQVREILQRVFTGITETLLNEGRLELRNFGGFEVKRRRPRRARNPRTGEAVEVPAKRVVTFRPGREMEERVGQLTKVPGRGTVAGTPSQTANGSLPDRCGPRGTGWRHLPGRRTGTRPLRRCARTG